MSKANSRKFERCKIKNVTCLLQVLGTEKVVSGGVVDISEGGMQIRLDTHPEELNICPERSFLNILGYPSENIPFPLSQKIVKMIWQNNRDIGCAFASPV